MLRIIHMHNNANFLLIHINMQILLLYLDCICVNGHEYVWGCALCKRMYVPNKQCLFALVLFFYRFAFCCHAHAEAFSTLPNLAAVAQGTSIAFSSPQYLSTKTLQLKYAYTFCVAVIVFFYCCFHTSGAVLLRNEIWFWNFHLFTFLFELSLLFQEIVSFSRTSICSGFRCYFSGAVADIYVCVLKKRRHKHF